MPEKLIDYEYLIKKYEPMRRKVAVIHLVTFIIGIPLIFGCFFALIIGMIITKHWIWVATCLPGCLLGVGLYIIGFTQKNKFHNAIGKEVRTALFDAYYPEREINADEGFTLEEILGTGFFTRKPDKWSSSHMMKVTYKGIPFKSANYQLKHRAGSNKENEDEYVNYAAGTMYFFDFEREFGAEIRILERKIGKIYDKKGLKQVETEYVDFNKKFMVLTDNESLVFYILTPQLQEKIMKLERCFKGQFYMRFVGSDLYVAVNDFFSSGAISLHKKLSIETINEAAYDIIAPLMIIDEVNLSSNKFKKNAGINN